MGKNAIDVISAIYKGLQERPNESLSLLEGEAGCCIFYKYFVDYFKDEASGQKLDTRIQNLAEDSLGNTLYTFCSGTSGINWFFSWLNKNELIDDEDFDVLCSTDHELSELSLSLMAVGQYDFLHGAIGIAYQLLYSRGKKFESYFSDFFVQLKKFSYNERGELYIADYDFNNHKLHSNQVNIGLAHGLPSVLKFCLQCYKQDICTVVAKSLAMDIIAFIKIHANQNMEICFFPSVVNLGEPNYGSSRLGWCYGDLTIALMLFQASKCFELPDLEKYALNILLKTTKRRATNQTFLKDAGICHGSAGIAHIYNRLWRTTGFVEFKETCDFWIEKTLEYGTFKDGIGGYKTYKVPTDSYINVPGLLEGACGVGLVLISYLTGDLSWDYSLMLND